MPRKKINDGLTKLQRWKLKNAEHVREYHREYMRRKRAEAKKAAKKAARRKP